MSSLSKLVLHIAHWR